MGTPRSSLREEIRQIETNQAESFSLYAVKDKTAPFSVTASDAGAWQSPHWVRPVDLLKYLFVEDLVIVSVILHSSFLILHSINFLFPSTGSGS